MRIEARASDQYAKQGPQLSAVDRSATAFSDALKASHIDDVRHADFASMTRQEMRDWVNNQLRSGEMSLDDSRPFMAMTMKIRVDSGSGGELSPGSDGNRYDFTRKVREGIHDAKSRNDETSLKMLESALQTIQRYQGQPIGIGTRS